MELVYNFIRFTLLFGFNTVVFKSFALPIDMIYFLGASLLFTITIVLHRQVLGFLTVRPVFLTRFIIISLLLGIIFFVMESILPGFMIEAFTMKKLSLGIVDINSIELPKYLALGLIAMFDGFVASLMYTLNKKG